MFGTPLTPDSIKAETAYRLERTKRAFQSARRRERPEQAGPAPAATGSPGLPAHRRAVTDPNAVPDPLPEIRDGVVTSWDAGKESVASGKR
ncbi:hypothetical protein AB0E63_34425 [Kribbella sp. NPDC026596]|uniref:hypothetical protein n=1 Tax=Kribbella sp. NPDC026596 TaxID=3155122 RepID=UPI0033CD984A